jgi:hypothetical protein
MNDGSALVHGNETKYNQAKRVTGGDGRSAPELVSQRTTQSSALCERDFETAKQEYEVVPSNTTQQPYPSNIKYSPFPKTFNCRKLKTVLRRKCSSHLLPLLQSSSWRQPPTSAHRSSTPATHYRMGLSRNAKPAQMALSVCWDHAAATDAP